MLDMGTLLITMARQYLFWFICAAGVDPAKFQVRRALTYHFVVADADMEKLNARHKSMTCTIPDAVADADMNKLIACQNR